VCRDVAADAQPRVVAYGGVHEQPAQPREVVVGQAGPGRDGGVDRVAAGGQHGSVIGRVEQVVHPGLRPGRGPASGHPGGPDRRCEPGDQLLARVGRAHAGERRGGRDLGDGGIERRPGRRATILTATEVRPVAPLLDAQRFEDLDATAVQLGAQRVDDRPDAVLRAVADDDGGRHVLPGDHVGQVGRERPGGGLGRQVGAHLEDDLLPAQAEHDDAVGGLVSEQVGHGREHVARRPEARLHDVHAEEPRPRRCGSGRASFLPVDNSAMIGWMVAPDGLSAAGGAGFGGLERGGVDTGAPIGAYECSTQAPFGVTSALVSAVRTRRSKRLRDAWESHASVGKLRDGWEAA
jgi:hypothetical protein